MCIHVSMYPFIRIESVHGKIHLTDVLLIKYELCYIEKEEEEEKERKKKVILRHLCIYIERRILYGLILINRLVLFLLRTSEKQR